MSTSHENNNPYPLPATGESPGTPRKLLGTPGKPPGAPRKPPAAPRRPLVKVDENILPLATTTCPSRPKKPPVCHDAEGLQKLYGEQFMNEILAQQIAEQKLSPAQWSAILKDVYGQ